MEGLMNVKDRDRSLRESLKAIEKAFGSGAAYQLGDTEPPEPVEVFSSGSLGVDAATRIGGIPRGRITEAFGVESGGKTTLALATIAEAQRQGEAAVYIDLENSFDPRYATTLGVDVNKLIVSQPDYAEEALSICETFILAGAVGIIVLDSVAMLVSKAELESEPGDAHVGLQARLMTQAMRRLPTAVRKSRVCLFFINQLREKIQAMGWGEPTTTPGGRALRHMASLRLDVRRIKTLTDDGKAVGARTKVRVVKNKCGAPFREAEFDLLYGEGISRESEVLDLGEQLGIITKEGISYSLNGTRLGRGHEATRVHLQQNPELFEQIRLQVRTALFGGQR